MVTSALCWNKKVFLDIEIPIIIISLSWNNNPGIKYRGFNSYNDMI